MKVLRNYKITLFVMFSLFLTTISFAKSYDSSFSVKTTNGYTLVYNHSEDLFTVLDSDENQVLKGKPKYSENVLVGFGGPSDKLFIFEVYGENSSASFTIFRYYREKNIPKFTRKAYLKINHNSKKSTGKVTQLQDFMAEEDRNRYFSFQAQTTLGGWINYNQTTREIQIANSSGDIIHSGLAYLEKTTLVGFGNRSIEDIRDFTFSDSISGQEIHVRLGLYPRSLELRTAQISFVTPWYSRNTRIADFFNFELKEDSELESNSNSSENACSAFLFN